MKKVFPLFKTYLAVPLLAGNLLAAQAASPKTNVDDSPVNRQSKVTTSFSPIIKKASPSVVSVYSSREIKPTPRFGRGGQNPFGPQGPQLDPGDPFWRFFGGPPQGPDDQSPRRERGMGSGVIISSDGYILTNNHVVEGADEVEVELAQGNETLTAKVVGTDPQTDVAVLKVDRKNLTPIIVGDSSKLEVGDIVLAIGNPFNVGQTVTMGIVSATGRASRILAPGSYEDFIQTDASINPGNSGGALIDAEGRLVGINTAILSRSGGNMGIGFAIPVNMARFVMDSILKDGKVTRGFLGLIPQPVEPGMAAAFGLTGNTGALVSNVEKGTPADKAGIKSGDVIVEFNGKSILDDNHLRLAASQTAPGTKVNIKLIRDGKEKTVTATLVELPNLLTGRGGEVPGRESTPDAVEGLELTDIDNRIRRQLGLGADINGALISDVKQGSQAAEAGLQQGAIIVSVNRKPVESAREALDLLLNAKGNTAVLHVYRSSGQPGDTGFYRYHVLKLKK